MPIGPAILQGVVEAFGFSVLPRMVGLVQDLLGVKHGENPLEIHRESVPVACERCDPATRDVQAYPFGIGAVW